MKDSGIAHNGLDSRPQFSMATTRRRMASVQAFSAVAAPEVSVIIPTFRRPHLVCHAVRSALTQSLETLEVIVVVDGADHETVDVLAAIDDPRLRIILPSHHLGNADARNAGVREAQGEWVAFLDDDDLWLPDKLDLQMETAAQSTLRYPIVSCRLVARTETHDFVWPQRYPRQAEPLSEYLFCRSSPLSGEGVVQTSTLFTKRCLLEAVPFSGELHRHVDLEWILKTEQVVGAGIIFVPERNPLVVWHIEENRERVSLTRDWQYSLSWIQRNKKLVTRRAYAAFILTMVSPIAAKYGNLKAFILLAWEAYRNGTPSLMDLLTHAGYFLIPQRVKRWAAARLAGPMPSRQVTVTPADLVRS